LIVHYCEEKEDDGKNKWQSRKRKEPHLFGWLLATGYYVFIKKVSVCVLVESSFQRTEYMEQSIYPSMIEMRVNRKAKVQSKYTN
jgi:hypothetical protein